jgi:CRISPR-associated protein Cas5h
MKAISFKLSGKTACFRKPDVNVYAYFTYNNIHKPALLGLFGAIIGLGGYTQLHDKKEQMRVKNKALKGKDKKDTEELLKNLDMTFPEFYEKLWHLKISITPLAPNGYFSKKIQTFNNSVGYASFETGGNLIIREQWLENPKWQIMILDDGSEEFVKISEYLLSGKSVFIPYLGKNDHFAKIDDVEMIEFENVIEGIKISSLFDEKSLTIAKSPARGELSFYFKEISPISLQKEYHFYEYKSLIFTNHKIMNGDYRDVYSLDGKNYAFI